MCALPISDNHDLEKKVTGTVTKGKTYTGRQSSDEGKQSKENKPLGEKELWEATTATVNGS